MSSPHLNNLIIIGCMFTYSSVIFLGLDSQLSSVTAFPYICTARAWLLMAGFSLAFGSMFSKTWRVHSIFTDVKLNKKVSTLNGQGMSYLGISTLDIYIFTHTHMYLVQLIRLRAHRRLIVGDQWNTLSNTTSVCTISKFLIDSLRATLRSFKVTLTNDRNAAQFFLQSKILKIFSSDRYPLCSTILRNSYRRVRRRFSSNFLIVTARAILTLTNHISANYALLYRKTPLFIFHSKRIFPFVLF